MGYIKIVKWEKRITEMKTVCSQCLAKGIKLSSFLGGNPNKIFIFVNFD